jgi:D-sedoheptulose 7-phosphate isomerase
MEDAVLDLMERATRQIRESCAVKQSLAPEFISRLCEISERTAKALKDGGCVFFCGNGGSAADAQHLAAEFVGRFRLERSPLPSVALTTNSSLLSAVANDYGYDQVFSRQIRAFGKPGDILIAISTSGMSPNILLAAREAKQCGLFTVGLTGRSGGRLRECTDVLLNVPSDDTPRIQESHILVGHIFCDLVETLLSSEKLSTD